MPRRERSKIRVLCQEKDHRTVYRGQAEQDNVSRIKEACPLSQLTKNGEPNCPKKWLQ